MLSKYEKHGVTLFVICSIGLVLTGIGIVIVSANMVQQYGQVTEAMRAPGVRIEDMKTQLYKTNAILSSTSHVSTLLGPLGLICGIGQTGGIILIIMGAATRIQQAVLGLGSKHHSDPVTAPLRR